MKTLNFKTFESNPEKYLDRVESDNEILFLAREERKGVVLLSVEEYNSTMETFHLMRSRKSIENIRESLAQIESGDVVRVSGI